MKSRFLLSTMLALKHSILLKLVENRIIQKSFHLETRFGTRFRNFSVQIEINQSQEFGERNFIVVGQLSGCGGMPGRWSNSIIVQM